jgi:acyl carrier protein
MKSTNEIVRDVLAHHLNRDASEVQPEKHLERDLDLSPMELALVALELEEIEEVTLPAHGLGSIQTVADLFALVSRAIARERRPRAIGRMAGTVVEAKSYG